MADRIRATIRHDAYWEDLAAFLSKSKKTKPKSNRTLFWEPNSPIAGRWNLPATIVDEQHAYRLLDYYKSRPWRSSEPIRVLDTQPRYVLLSVDLSETAHRLHQVFGTLVDFYQKDLGWAEPRRNGPFRCDPFEIYDLVEKNTSMFLKQRRRFFQKPFTLGQGPAYSTEAKRVYGQASRAYQWVKNI